MPIFTTRMTANFKNTDDPEIFRVISINLFSLNKIDGKIAFDKLKYRPCTLEDL